MLSFRLTMKYPWYKCDACGELLYALPYGMICHSAGVQTLAHSVLFKTLCQVVCSGAVVLV